jgi:16S rRNA (guanine1207-N2)-methyltransferase
MELSECHLDSPWGGFELKRYPVSRSEQLRAWDAADEYLLEYMADMMLSTQQEQGLSPTKILIFDDQFGGLSIPLLSQGRVTCISDSSVSRDSILSNAKSNGMNIDHLQILNSLEDIEGQFDFIFFRVSKNLRYFEEMIARVLSHSADQTVVVGASMVKYLPKSALKILEGIITEVRTSLAKKKARLIFCSPQKVVSASSSLQQFTVPEWSMHLNNYSNVFAADKLDIGARFMLDFIPATNKKLDIFDLACGSGVLGILAAKLNPMANLCFLDDSTMAVESAYGNFKHAFPDRLAEFRNVDVMNGIPDDSADYVLCNPPFHQQGSINRDIALRMFQESFRVLRAGGIFLVVGNRHLNYHFRLKQIFKQVELLGSNRKFVVLKGVKR